MAKEESVATEQPKKLTPEQLGAYANHLENELKKAYASQKEMQKEITMYQMQDYYQRAQLLCVILANDKINAEFRAKCEAELIELVYPPKQEENE